MCLPVRLLEGVTCQERGSKKKTFYCSFQSSSSGTLNERAERKKKKKISLCKFWETFFNLSFLGFLMFICNDLFSILGRAEGTVFSTQQKISISYK